METFAIDLSPLTGPLIELVAAAVIAALGVGLKLVLNLVALKTGLQVEEAQRVKINEALENAVIYAKGRVNDWAQARDNVAVKNALVAQGAEYVLKAVPEALAYLDVDPDGVASLVETRLEKALKL